MRIWGDFPKVLGVSNRQRRVGKVGGVKALNRKRDELSISDRAKDFQTLLKALQEVPDVRTGKVDEISKKLGVGKYNVSSGDVSEKIIQKIMENRV